jgi:site-specific DNA-methyltransferase (adenine-specific)
MDMLDNKKIDADVIIKKLMKIWKNDPINSFKTLLRNLDNDYEEFDNSTQKLINNSFTKNIKDNKISIDVVFKDEEDEMQELSKGKEIIKDKKTDKKDKKIEEINISFTKDVLPFIIPLTCILTIKQSNTDFVKMLNCIKDNPDLLEIFDEQCLIWFNKNNLIDLIKSIIEKYFDKKSNTYNISIQFKMSLKSLIDTPKELLELINDCLKPKDVEKKQFGEVFTPMNFINDNMLKDLEEYWLKKKGKNIWANKHLTWYDPAAGMGNYPIAIYYKLMDGLKDKIKDEKKRKKHIIEKQLYMGELNKKNCFVIKQIFDINDKYKLNLYEGDTLNIDLNKIFGIDKFDIIIGNPPYNKEVLIHNVSLPIYNEFIEYYIDKCNLLSFIIPSKWFSGGKGLDKFRKMMINRTDIVFIKHLDNACKIFGKQVDIKGGVNYFLIDSKYDGLCDYNNKLIRLNTFDIIIDGKYFEIIDKLTKYKNITDIYNSQDHYKVQSNDKRLSDNNNLTVCFVSKQKGFIKYIDKKHINEKSNYGKWKVLTTSAAHDAHSGFGNIFIGKPNEIHCKTYIAFNINNHSEALSLLSYMKCRLPNFMLSLRKISHNLSGDTCKWIPLPPLTEEWTDYKVYNYFKLLDDEIDLIKNTKIIGYKDIIVK